MQMNRRIVVYKNNNRGNKINSEFLNDNLKIGINNIEYKNEKTNHVNFLENKNDVNSILKNIYMKNKSIAPKTKCDIVANHSFSDNNIWVPIYKNPEFSCGQSDIYLLYKMIPGKTWDIKYAVAKNFKDEDSLALESKIFNIIKKKSMLINPKIYKDYLPEKYGKRKTVIDGVEKKFLLLEYIDGSTLSNLITNKKLNVRLVKRILFQLCEVIGFLHDIGIAHRDIKPQNIIVTGEKNNDNFFIENTVQIKLIDFGLSYYSKKKRNCFDSVGTINYCAPEIFEEKSEGYNPYKTDLWSLGIVLYSMLNFHSPYITPVENNDMFLDFLNRERYHDNDILNFIIKNLCSRDNPNNRLDCSTIKNNILLKDNKDFSIYIDNLYEIASKESYIKSYNKSYNNYIEQETIVRTKVY
jgi:hypothetical protein